MLYQCNPTAFYQSESSLKRVGNQSESSWLQIQFWCERTITVTSFEIRLFEHGIILRIALWEHICFFTEQWHLLHVIIQHCSYLLWCLLPELSWDLNFTRILDLEKTSLAPQKNSWYLYQTDTVQFSNIFTFTFYDQYSCCTSKSIISCRSF